MTDSNLVQWKTVRAPETLRVFGRFQGTDKLFDERSNYERGVHLVLGVPERLILSEEKRIACRVLYRAGQLCQIPAYVVLGDFKSRHLLHEAAERLNLPGTHAK